MDKNKWNQETQRSVISSSKEQKNLFYHKKHIPLIWLLDN